MKTKVEKVKKVKEPLPKPVKKFKIIIGSIIIFLVVLAITLTLLVHFNVLSENVSKSAHEIWDEAHPKLPATK